MHTRMMDVILKNKIILVVAALAILGGLWYGFSGGSPSSPVLGTESQGGAVSSEDKDIVASLLQLRSVTLSGTIFSSPVFQGLKDFSTDITQEPVGRTDPFAPLASPSQSSASAAGAAAANPFSSR